MCSKVRSIWPLASFELEAFNSSRRTTYQDLRPAIAGIHFVRPASSMRKCSNPRIVNFVPSLRTLSCSTSAAAPAWRDRPLVSAKSSDSVVISDSGSSRMAEPLTWPRPDNSGGGS
jgi:hypothetical protein